MTNFEIRRAIARMKRIEEARQERFRRFQMLESRGQQELGKRGINTPYDPDKDILVKKRNERNAYKLSALKDFTEKKFIKNLKEEINNWNLLTEKLYNYPYNKDLVTADDIEDVFYYFYYLDNNNKISLKKDGLNNEYFSYDFYYLDRFSWNIYDSVKYFDCYFELSRYLLNDSTKNNIIKLKFDIQDEKLPDIKYPNINTKLMSTFETSSLFIKFQNSRFAKMVSRATKNTYNGNAISVYGTGNEFPIKKRLEALEEFLDVTKDIANRW